MIRRLSIVVLVLLMASFGFGVYSYLGTLKSTPKVTARVVKPTHTKPRFVLPGTMFLAQGGVLYRLQDGQFTQIASGGWTQPTLTPDHKRLVAVARSAAASDLYLLDFNGQVIRQLTHNTNRDVSFNHWSLFPRVSPDGQTVCYSYDPKNFDNLNRVDLAVYCMPIHGSQSQARRWTDPYWYSGGDLQPIPLASGALLYTKFNMDSSDNAYSQLWLQRAPFSTTIGRPLTPYAESCAQPALSPDGRMVAMICNGGGQVGKLEVASFDGATMGSPRVLLDGQLCAAPAWSPDGQGLAYFAPTGANGHFQLFYLALPPAPTPAATATAAALSPSAHASPSASHTPAPTPTPTPTPPAPLQVSDGLDLDTTGPPAWF